MNVVIMQYWCQGGQSGKDTRVVGGRKGSIQAEEIFRLAVRRELEAKEPIPSRKSQVWRILNSSFVLWFLSSVLVASLTAVLANYAAGRAQRIRQAETIQRLDTEIADRLFMIRTSLCLERSRIAKGERISAKGMYNTAVNYLDNAVVDPATRKLDFSVYPEYKNRTFRSLLFELSTIIDSSQVPLVKELTIDNEKFADLSEFSENEALDQEQSSMVLEGLLKKVNKYLAEDRWRRRSMPTLGGECEY